MHTLELTLAVSLVPLALSLGCDVAGPEGGDDVLDSTEESQGDDEDQTPEADDDNDDAPEPCGEYGQSRSCTMASGGAGTQFCTGDQNLTWGTCLESVE